MEKATLVIHNIGQLLTMQSQDEPLGDAQKDPVAGLGLILDAALAISGEKIIWVGKESELGQSVDTSNCSWVDVAGRVVMPGLIDCHTHCVYAGSRAQDFARRVGGASYEEILAAGGGIHTTVRATREASVQALVALANQRLDRFLAYGVTTIEIKSGYGLETSTELKMLQAASQLNLNHVIDIVSTFLGAHVVPNECAHERQMYIDIVIHEMIPTIVEQKLATFCDVFCDQGAFTLTETRRILSAALDKGLKPKIHGEQLCRSGSVALAIELGAQSIDHLEYANESDAQRLANSEVVAVLLPGATYFLGKHNFANGRMLADAGCKVAVSTDLNPGSCHTENLPLILNMACLYNKLYPREVLLGATRRAAQALGLEQKIGSLQAGYDADILVLDRLDYRDFIYHFGINQTEAVYKKGCLVYSANSNRHFA